MRRGTLPAQRDNNSSSHNPKIPPATGPVRVYLDDERPCPPGWTLARSPAEFWNLIETIDLQRIEAISLDWYLGAGIDNGVIVAQALSERIQSDPAAFSQLEMIGLHSSDHEQAINMARLLEKSGANGERPPFYVHVGRIID